AAYFHSRIYLVLADTIEVVERNVELGGADQYWNLLVGRELQRASGQEPQVVMTVPLLEGTDGKLKMSKSYDNYIGITEPPNEMYGKLMSIPDEMIPRYFQLAAGYDAEQLAAVDQGLRRGDNPRDWKDRLARAIVSRYHGQAAADAAAEEFARVFRRHEDPEAMSSFELNETKPLVDIVTGAGLLASRSEFRRKVTEGAIYLDGRRISDPELELCPGATRVLRVGKRKFLRIVPPAKASCRTDGGRDWQSPNLGYGRHN
ncbi:MAG: tyrosine--tRNA ligase, partial [candidate division WOR-3 bacterium]